MILTLKGHQVVNTANNGKKAVDLFKSSSKKPDIVLMDHRMPIKNGLETAKEILECDKSTKIIFTSADHSIKEEALAIGAINFIEKPFSFDTLLCKIDFALKPLIVSGQ